VQVENPLYQLAVTEIRQGHLLPYHLLMERL